MWEGRAIISSAAAALWLYGCGPSAKKEGAPLEYEFYLDLFFLWVFFLDLLALYLASC